MAAHSVDDTVLAESYRELGNVWRVAERHGMKGGTVHYRLRKMGVAKRMNTLSEDDLGRIARDYRGYRDAGRLADLATEMGRTKQFICRAARNLGLTDKMTPRHYNATWKYVTEAEALAVMNELRASPLGLNEFCRERGIDDLGLSRTLQRYFPDEWDVLMEAKVKHGSMYQIGRRFEYVVLGHLAAMGFTAARSPRSRSPADLIAIGHGRALAVQCRTCALQVDDWNALFDLAAASGSIPVLAQPGLDADSVQLWRLTERKDGSKRPQPMVALALGAA